MAAFTTIFAGLSALAGVAGVVNAKNAQKKQAAALKKQERTAKTIALEAGKLESQDQGAGVADIVLGTSKEEDERLKKDSRAKSSSAGTSVGGLGGLATNIGGL